ncbi:MAG: PAS domain S-box protein [Ignavibacteriales bacterium]|nr:PAS domain S-box protein [Ignavibacteriales bacterium]
MGETKKSYEELSGEVERLRAALEKCESENQSVERARRRVAESIGEEAYKRLRSLAERALVDGESKAESELTTVFHELEVAHLELALQNEELRESREAIESLHEKYHDLFESAPVAYFILEGSDGKILEANRAAGKLLGMDRKTLPGKLLSLFVDGPFRREFSSKFATIVTQDEPLAMSTRLVADDGSAIDVGFEAAVVDRAERERRVRAVVVDLAELTEYRRKARIAEENLQRERNFVQTLVNHMPDFVYAKDERHRFIICNDALAKAFGANSGDDIVGKSDIDFSEAALARQFMADEKRIMESGAAIVNQRKPGEYPDGRKRWIETTKAPLYDEHGKIVGIVGVGRDVTDRHNLENAYRALIENLSLGVAVIQNERVVYYNQRLEKIFGFSGADFREASFDDLTKIIHPEDREEAVLRFEKIFTEGPGVVRSFNRFIRKDGATIYGDVALIQIEYDGAPAIQATLEDVTERRLAEARIRKSEGRLRAIVNGSPDGVIVANLSGDIEFVSEQSARQLLVPSIDEMTGTSVWTYLLPEERERAINVWDRLLAGESVPELIYRAWRADGTTFFMEVSAKVIDEGGGASKMVIVHRDVTNRINAEREKDSFSRLSQRLTQPLTLREIGRTVAIESRRLFDHDAFLVELLDHEAKQVVGVYAEDTPVGAEAPKEFEPTTASFDEVREPRFFRAGSFVINRTPDDSVAALVRFGETERESKSLMFAPIIWHNKTIGMLSAQSYEPGKYSEADLTLLSIFADQCAGAIARVVAERNLRQSERTLRAFIDHSSDGVAITDEQGVVILWNEACERISGVSAEEAIGAPLWKTQVDMLHPSARTTEAVERIKQIAEQLIETGKAPMETPFEITFKDRRGETRTILQDVYTMPVEHGYMLGTLVRDVTDRKRYERELRRAKLEAERNANIKSVVLSNLSHEFRTPMNGILGFAALLRDQLTVSPEREMATKIFQSSKRLMKTLGSLMDLTQLETGVSELIYHESEVAELCSQTAAAYRSEADRKGVSIEFVEREPVVASVDREKFKQALGCLIDNAIKYTEEGGVVVELDKNEGDGQWRCKVIDTGVGIEEEKMPYIFEAFRQSSEGSNRRFEGLGVGLTIAKRLTELMGGSIKIHSEPGAGVAATMAFPLVREKVG